MLVKDFMIKEVYVARPDFTLKEILRILIENKVGGVPVVDEHDKLLGMVTDGDILRYLTPAEKPSWGISHTLRLFLVKNWMKRLHPR